jgi:hypothetical protein
MDEIIQRLKDCPMRTSLAFASLLLIASPALAQPPASPPAHVPPQLLDPRMADRVADTMQSLSKALLDLPVGELQAAVEGRAPTAADKKLTVRDLGRRDDPNFDRNFRQQIAQARPAIEKGMKAMSAALPAIEKAVDDASRALDRAAANMPDPTYPKR